MLAPCGVESIHHDAVGLLQRHGWQHDISAGLYVQDVGPSLVAGELYRDAMFAGEYRPGRRCHASGFAVDQHVGAGRPRGDGDLRPVRRERHGHRLRPIQAFHVELDGSALIARMAHEGRLGAGCYRRLERRFAALFAAASDFDQCAFWGDVEGHSAGQLGHFQNHRLVALGADADAAVYGLVAACAGAHPIAALAEQVNFAQLEGEAALYGERIGARMHLDTY